MGQCSGKVSTKKFVCGDLIEVTGLRYATLQLADVTVTINGEQLPHAAEQRLKIRDILKEHSEGAQFSKKVFSVLPDVATLAEVQFGIGCEMERYHFCGEKYIGTNRDFLTGDPVKDSSRMYSFDLVGYKQVRELSLTLDIRPCVGPLAGKNVSFWWRNNTLEVKGGGPNYSFSFARHHWYHSFSSVSEFCKICLHIVHHVPRTAATIGLHDFLAHNDDQQGSNERLLQEQPWTLSQFSSRTLMCHLDAIPTGLAIPTRYLSNIYSGCDPVDMTLHLWPSTFHNGKSCRITVLDGLLYCELTHMIMLRYNIGPSYQLKWYENFKPVSGMQQIGVHSKRVDCFIVNKFVDSELEDVFYGEEQPLQATVPIIISLVGFEVKDLYVNPSMTVKEFDKEVRKLFGLKSDSFLVLLPEGDLSPQYSRNDQWKCVYPLLLGSQTQHRSSSSGSDIITRRSSNRNGSSNYAPRGQSGTTDSPEHQSTSSFRLWQPFQRSNSVRQSSSTTSSTPNGLSSFQRSMSIRPTTKSAPSPMMLATKLLSNDHRNFPMHKNIHGLSIDEVYDMPMYSLDLERYGIFSHSVVQVFEVTGPTVPIAFCGSTPQQRSMDHNSTPSHVKSRSINLMDINPTWPIPTLTQYVEAIICPRQAVSQKKITLGNNILIDSVDVMKLKVSEILDVWKPVWWKSKGSSSAHHKTSSKDITPEDVLVIEAMNHQYN